MSVVLLAFLVSARAFTCLRVTAVGLEAFCHEEKAPWQDQRDVESCQFFVHSVLLFCCWLYGRFCLDGNQKRFGSRSGISLFVLF